MVSYIHIPIHTSHCLCRADLQNYFHTLINTILSSWSPFSDWNVVDICNDTFQTFSGGHIIYSQNNVSHRSCDCSIKGATTITIRDYNPYHNGSTCLLDRLVINENRFSNTGKLNSDNICFTVYNTSIPGDPGDTNITLNLDDDGAPKRLWISFEGLCFRSIHSQSGV